MPETVEQRITVERIALLDAGLWGIPGLASETWLAKIMTVLEAPSFTERAQAFSQTYAEFSPDKSIESVTRRYLEICDSK